jgi:hypothetical protein
MKPRTDRKARAAKPPLLDPLTGPACQPEFLGVLNRLIHGTAAEAAPEQLLAKVFARLDEAAGHPCVSGPAKALADREHSPETRTRLKLLEAIRVVATAPEGQRGPDALLAGAEKIHAKIERGRHKPRPAATPDELSPELKGFAGLPAFRAGRIQASRCGLVKLGKTKGLFIEYGSCREGCLPSTLMAFKTPRDPDAETVELNGRRYWASRHAEHTLTAWRGEKDRWLYILICHCPFKNAVALAELLRS